MSLLIPPPVVAAIVGILMWAVTVTLPFGQVEWPLRMALASALLVAGVLLIAVAAAQFFAAKTTINPMRPARASHLITTGVFALSRNPIYLADLLMLCALAVWLGNVFNAALPLLFVCYIRRYQIAPEEHALTQCFGEAYQAYCSRVRRWL